MKLNRMKINVKRTTSDTIFDLTFLVLTLAVWGIIIWLIGRAPDVVPTHFGASGEPDAWGSPTSVVFPCLICTAVSVVLIFSIYLPFGTINLPFYQGEGNPRQVRLAVLMTRTIAVLTMGLTLFIAVSMLALTTHSITPVLVIFGLLIAVALVFMVLMYKAK